MKKSFIAAAMSGAMMLSMVGAQFAYADIIPPGQKPVEVCASILGLAKLSNITVYASEYGPLYQNPAPFVKSWVIHDGDCIAPSGGKYGRLDLYALDSTYAKTLSINYDPATDTEHAYPASAAIDTAQQFVPETDATTYYHNDYLIPGVDNTKHQLVVLSTGHSTNLMVADALPTVPAGVETSMNGGTSASTGDSPFTDVVAGSTYYDALVYLKAQGIVTGYADGSFKPNNTINRAEFTKIVVGALNHATDVDACMGANVGTTGYLALFTDVLGAKEESDLAWYTKFVCYAKVNHLIDGYSDGSFKPSQEINFVEAAKIVVNSFKLAMSSAAGAQWYSGYVESLAGNKAIPTTIVHFDQKLTRGEMAEIIFRLKTQNLSKPSLNMNLQVSADVAQ